MKLITPEPIPPLPLPDDHPLKAVEVLRLNLGDLLVVTGPDDEKTTRFVWELSQATRRQVIYFVHGETIQGLSKKELRKLVKAVGA